MAADWTGKKAAKEIEKLDQERLKAWARIEALEKEVRELKKDPENSARHQYRKTTEVRRKADERLVEVEVIALKLEQEAEAGMVNARKIDEARQKASEARVKTESEAEALVELSANLSAKLTEFETFDENHPDFETEIERLEAVLSGSESQYTKLSQILKNAETRRKEIVEKHQEVFGFEQDDDDGETTKQPGLVDELEGAYSDLDKKLKTSEEALKIALATAVKSSADARKIMEEGASEQLTHRKNEFEATQKRIETLLPGATAAGLADAYADKVKNEIAEREKHRKEFSLGIYIMLGIAVIPLVVSLIFLWDGTKLPEVIDRLPKVAIATAFLYGAAIWKTAAAGRRQRLSKRLIEEYSHKEAQSRTFVGLSQQVSDLGDDELSQDLKLKLLYNLVQISSENPGKLITDYKKSDHPIYELSEQSAKLASAIEKVKRIPGGEFIGEILQGKRDRIVKTADTQTQQGLAAATTTGKSDIKDAEA